MSFGESAVEMDLTARLPSLSEVSASASSFDRYAEAQDRAKRSVEGMIGPHERLLALRTRIRQEMMSPGGITNERALDLKAREDELSKQLERLKPKPIKVPEVKQPDPPKVVDRFTDSQERVSNSLSQMVGPYERLLAIRKQITQEASAPGGISADRQKDLDYALKKAQGHVDGLQPKVMEHQIASMLYSSRFGGNGAMGGIMPLVGKGLDAASGGNAMALMSNPYTLAAAAVYKLGEAAYSAAEQAAEAGRQFSDVRNASGGTTAESAQLSIYSSTFGRDFGALSKTLNERITTDPMARGFAASMGVANTPGAWGNQNYAGNLLKAIEGLRKITDSQERLRVARSLGIEDALPLTQVSSTTFNGLKKDADIRSRIMDPEFERNSADFNAEGKRVGQGLSDVNTALGKKVLPFFTNLMRGVANTAEGIADDFNNKSLLELNFDIGQFLHDPVGAITRIAANGSLNYSARGQSDGAGNSPEAAKEAELKRNTEALAGMTKMLGAGDRTKSAMPGSLGGDQIVRLSELHALQHFSL